MYGQGNLKMTWLTCYIQIRTERYCFTTLGGVLHFVPSSPKFYLKLFSVKLLKPET